MITRSLLIVTAALLSLPSLASAQGKARRFERSVKGFKRDLKRLKRLPRVNSLTKLLDSKSAFSGKIASSDTWTPAYGSTDGKKNFTVDLGKGCKIEGSTYHVNLPSIANFNKLTKLDVVKGKTRVSLMPKNSKRPVILGHDTSYNFERDKVNWHGPQSRFAVLALLHEYGHAKDYTKMSDAQRADMGKIYDTTALKQPLTPQQHRKLVSYERSAWAHALKKARKLKRQGLDIFGGASNKEVMGTIYSCMKGYYEYGQPAQKK